MLDLFDVLEDHHGIVGATSLPQTLTTLLNNSRRATEEQKSARIPQKIAISAAYELLRVGANVCMDHGKLQIFDSRTVVIISTLYLGGWFADVFFSVTKTPIEVDC